MFRATLQVHATEFIGPVKSALEVALPVVLGLLVAIFVVRIVYVWIFNRLRDRAYDRQMR